MTAATTTDTTTDAAVRHDVWWRSPFRMLQTNLREIDATMDVERAIDDIVDHGANAWLVNGGGILSFYPTDLPFQTRNPFLRDRPSGDLLGDAFAAARARGIRVLARMDFSKVSLRIAGEHPDWLYMSADGMRQEYQGLVSVCPSAPYYQERAFEVLTELAERYPVDGFFFNWMSFNEMDYRYHYWGPCHCGHCVDAFDAFSGGMPFPVSSDDASHPVWRAFVVETLERLTARFREHIATLLPDAALILGERADIMFHEANSKVGREFWPFATSQAVSISKSRRPEVPVLVNCAVFVDMPYRYAPIQNEHLSMYFVQAIARGAIPSTYTMGPPVAAPFPNLTAAAEVTRFHRDHPAVYEGLQQSAATLLVTPRGATKTTFWDDPNDDEYRGEFEALQRAHIPFDMGTTDDLLLHLHADRPRPYSVIVLSDTGELPADVVAALDDWVEAGGALVAIGSSAIDGTHPQSRTSPAIRRAAVHTDPQILKNTYVAEETPGVGDGFDRVSPIFGALHYLDLHDDVERRGVILGQVPFGPPEKCYGTLPTGYAGVAIARHGSGAHAVVPWSIGATYRQLGTPPTGRILQELVADLLDGREDVSADLPEQVEITVARTPTATVVHIVNFSGLQRNSIGAALPIDGGELRVRGAARATARAHVAGRDLQTRSEGDVLIIELPRLGQFEVVEIARA